MANKILHVVVNVRLDGGIDPTFLLGEFGRPAHILFNPFSNLTSGGKRDNKFEYEYECEYEYEYEYEYVYEYEYEYEYAYGECS